MSALEEPWLRKLGGWPLQLSELKSMTMMPCDDGALVKTEMEMEMVVMRCCELALPRTFRHATEFFFGVREDEESKPLSQAGFFYPSRHCRRQNLVSTLSHNLQLEGNFLLRPHTARALAPLVAEVRITAAMELLQSLHLATENANDAASHVLPQGSVHVLMRAVNDEG